jgi:hypothetical protein
VLDKLGDAVSERLTTLEIVAVTELVDDDEFKAVIVIFVDKVNDDDEVGETEFDRDNDAVVDGVFRFDGHVGSDEMERVAEAESVDCDDGDDMGVCEAVVDADAESEFCEEAVVVELAVTVDVPDEVAVVDSVADSVDVAETVEVAVMVNVIVVVPDEEDEVLADDVPVVD